MATTQKGIYYPDDYTAVADVLEDMKKQAESVDTAIGNVKETIEQNIQTQIDNINEEQTTQNNEIEALQTENTRLKATLPTTTGEGENITLDKTAEMEFIQPPLPRGNSTQATSILPTGYTQLEYIESTGTQYIDTGITADDTVEFDIDFETFDQFSGGSGYGSVFGSRQASVQKELQITTFNDIENIGGTFRYGDSGAYEAYLTRATKTNIKLKNKKYYVDGEEKYTVNKTFSNNYNIYIFALNNGGTVVQNGKVRIYTFRLYKNGVLVRDYIPCKNVSNEVGLYDLVSKTFFGNNGTGTFTAGNTATLPNPNFEVPIQNVTGDVEVLVQNKNIWSTVFNNTAANRIRSKDYTIVKPNLPYLFNAKTSTNNILNGYFVQYDENLNNIGETSWATLPMSITTKQNCKYLWIFLKYSTGANISTNEISDIQLEQGTTATTYTPHKEQTYTFPLGTQRMYLGDYLADDGIHHVRKQVVLDGSGNWVDYLTQVEGFYKAYTTGLKTNSKFYQNALCSHFAVKSTSNYVSAIEQCIASNANATYISISNSIVSNATELKTWLSEHNVTLEYELATEEITPYTTEQQTAYDEIKQAISYEEQTNITGSSDEANPIFKVEAYQSMKLVLQEISNAVVALGGV